MANHAFSHYPQMIPERNSILSFKIKILSEFLKLWKKWLKKIQINKTKV